MHPGMGGVEVDSCLAPTVSEAMAERRVKRVTRTGIFIFSTRIMSTRSSLGQ